MANRLLCTFTTKEKVKELADIIFSRYTIPQGKIFVFSLDGSEELLATYNVQQPIVGLLADSFIANRNKTTNTIFTINALNSLVIDITGYSDKSYKVKWEDYANMVILTNGTGSGVRKLKTSVYDIYRK